MLIGLDSIIECRLCQDHNLKITRALPEYYSCSNSNNKSKSNLKYDNKIQINFYIKKTGTGSTKENNRKCIDFRQLKKLLVLESQPFPLIEKI